MMPLESRMYFTLVSLLLTLNLHKKEDLATSQAYQKEDPTTQQACHKKDLATPWAHQKKDPTTPQASHGVYEIHLQLWK